MFDAVLKRIAANLRMHIGKPRRGTGLGNRCGQITPRTKWKSAERAAYLLQIPIVHCRSGDWASERTH
jgi:hypothetical protein